MQDFASSFERLMALFRYRGLDSGALSLTPGSNQTMQALIEAGQKVVKDLEDLAKRQATVIESSTRQLMGSAQALSRPDQFREASETNLKTLTKAAETTLNHLSELAELLMKYNAEVVSTMNQGVFDSMRGQGASPVSAPAPKPAPVVRATPAAKPKKPAAKRPAKPRRKG